MDIQRIAVECVLGDFPGTPVVKNLPPSAGDVGSIPGGGTKMPRAHMPRKSSTTAKS